MTSMISERIQHTGDLLFHSSIQYDESPQDCYVLQLQQLDYFTINNLLHILTEQHAAAITTCQRNRAQLPAFGELLEL